MFLLSGTENNLFLLAVSLIMPCESALTINHPIKNRSILLQETNRFNFRQWRIIVSFGSSTTNKECETMLEDSKTSSTYTLYFLPALPSSISTYTVLGTLSFLITPPNSLTVVRSYNNFKWRFINEHFCTGRSSIEQI